ncbi:MAG: hypothetical protein ABL903_06775 [Methylococcales bacterium]
MPTLVSNVKDILLNWNSVIIQSPLISVVILGAIAALTIWLLVSLYYRIKAGSVRKRLLKVIAVNEQARLQLSETLSNTAQQVQAIELELNGHKQQVEQLKAAHELSQGQIKRALAQESQIDSDLVSLQTQFFLNEPLPVKADSDTSLSWQQYRSVVNELTGRLKTGAQFQLELQQEKSKLKTLLAEQTETIQGLNQQIAAQITNVGKREQQFAAQQTQMQQQQEQLKAELLQALDKLKQPLQVVEHRQIAGSAPVDGHVNPAGALSEVAAATNNLLETFGHQIEDTAHDILDTLKSVVNEDEQQSGVNVLQSAASPVVVEDAYNRVLNEAVAARLPIEQEPPETQPLNAQAPVSKLKKIFGRFSTSALVDYVETALEKNDAKVAEQMLEDSNLAEAVPEKTKRFWRKIKLTN